MKKIVKTTYVGGCSMAQNVQCPYFERVRSGWFCNLSQKMIAAIPDNPYFNIAPHLGQIPDWCELEDK